jgi:hypothetical protein
MLGNCIFNEAGIMWHLQLVVLYSCNRMRYQLLHMKYYISLEVQLEIHAIQTVTTCR